VAAHRADATARPEIWAYGLRNPWRFSFDRTDGVVNDGDVPGQGTGDGSYIAMTPAR
jgi:glucose/arabinose dehydrogenase